MTTKLERRSYVIENNRIINILVDENGKKYFKTEDLMTMLESFNIQSLNNYNKFNGNFENLSVSMEKDFSEKIKNNEDSKSKINNDDLKSKSRINSFEPKNCLLILKKNTKFEKYPYIVLISNMENKEKHVSEVKQTHPLAEIIFNIRSENAICLFNVFKDKLGLDFYGDEFNTSLKEDVFIENLTALHQKYVSK